MDKEERDQEIAKIFASSVKLPPVESIKVVTPEVLLEHNFRVWVLGRGRDYQVTLTTTSLILVPSKPSASIVPPPLCCLVPCNPGCLAVCCSGPRIEIHGRDVVACRPAPNGGPFFPKGSIGRKKEKQILKRMDPAIAGHPVFMLVAYPTKKKSGGRKKMNLYFHLPPKRDDGFAAQTTENPIEAKNSDGSRRQRQTAVAAKVRDTWVHAIETSMLPEIIIPPFQSLPYVGPGAGPPKLLVIVNPVAGTKNCEKIMKDELVPFLTDAGIDFEVLISRYPGHVREVVYNERLSDWRGVITVSGDGMIHEILNGLFDRPDWREALSRLPLGLIPGGSGNGLARSILNELDEPFDGTGLGSALLNVARGRVKNLDLFYVESTQMEPRLGFLSICYGILADVDIESEKLRWMGQTRFRLYALQRIASLRTYRAKLWYLPASDYSELEKPREKTRPETIRNLEAGLKPDNDGEDSDAETDCNSTKDSTSSQSNSTKDDLTDGTSNRSDENPDESLERDVPEITLVEESYDPTKAKAESRQSLNQPSEHLLTKIKVDEATNQEVTVLPPDYQFLFNRFSYSNLLTQGHLYFRSWDELQYQVLGSIPSGSNTLLSGIGPSNVLSRHPFDKNMPTNSETESSYPQREGPKFRELPPLDNPLPTQGSSSTNDTNSLSSHDGSSKSYMDDWIYEEDDFVGLSVHNLPFITPHTMISPKSRVDDGIFYLVIFRKNISKKNLIQVLMEVEKGAHVNIPGVEYIPIRGIRIEPLGNPTQGAGLLTLDGEAIPSGKVQAHIMPASGKIFVK